MGAVVHWDSDKERTRGSEQHRAIESIRLTRVGAG